MDEVPNRTHDVKSNLDKMYLSKREKSRKTISKFSLVNYKNIYYNDLIYDEYIKIEEKERKYLQFEMLPLKINENLTNENTSYQFKSSNAILEFVYLDNNCNFYTSLKPVLLPTAVGKSYSENVEPVELNSAEHPKNVQEDRLSSFTNIFKRKSVFTITACAQNTSEEIIIEEKQSLRETILNKSKILTNGEQNIDSPFCESSDITFKYVSRKHSFKTNLGKEKIIEQNLKNGDSQFNYSDRFHINIKTSDVSGKINFFSCLKFKHNYLLGGRKLVFSKCKELGNILYIKKKWDDKNLIAWFYIMHILYKKINYIIFFENWRLKENVRLKKKKNSFQKRELNLKQNISNYTYRTAEYLIFFPSIYKANCNIIGWSLGKIDKSMHFWNYNTTNTVVQVSKHDELVKHFIGFNFISSQIRFLNQREKLVGNTYQKQKPLQFSLDDKKHQLVINERFDSGDFVKPESFIPEICVPIVITKKLKDVSSLKVKSVPLPCKKQKQCQKQPQQCQKQPQKCLKPSSSDSCCSINSTSSKGSNSSRSSTCSRRKKCQKKPKKVKKCKVEKKKKKSTCFRRSRSRDSVCSKGSKGSRCSRKSNSSTESCDSRKGKKKKVHKKKRSKKCKPLKCKQKGSGSDLSCKSSQDSLKSSCSSVCVEVTQKTASGWSKLCPCSSSCSKVNECRSGSQLQQKPSKEGDRRGICKKQSPKVKCKNSKTSCPAKFFAKVNNICGSPKQKQECYKHLSVNGKFRVTADYECGKIDIDVDKKSRKRLIEILNKFAECDNKCRK